MPVGNDMSQGAWTLVVVLMLAGVFGFWRAARDGRFRGALAVPVTLEPAPPVDQAVDRAPERSPGSRLAEIGHELGERATLLQFSSAFCAPCRATRRVLGEVATVVPGVAHVEIDAEAHLDLVRRLHVARTPTTLELDADGAEVSRASGAPTRDAVLTTLGRVIEPCSHLGHHVRGVRQPIPSASRRCVLWRPCSRPC